MNKDNLNFHPFHPTSEKTKLIETTFMPLIKQDNPFNAKDIFEELTNDFEKNIIKYNDKRFEVEGIVKYVGDDIHYKPSIQVSNKSDGDCYVLTVFPNNDFYDKVFIGDKVVIRGNYLVLSNQFGVVLKNSELTEIIKRTK